MIKWLDRGTVRAPSLALCTTPAGFLEVMKHLKVPNPQTQEWLGPAHAARVHTMENAKHGTLACVVCIDPAALAKLKYTDNEIKACLVHEAVHIKQALMESIGETRPSSEFEAYTVQNISQELMNEYDRQTKRGKANRKLA